MASSSSTKHDVFLSFRGEDTRCTFTSHLYAALCRKGIDTFIDDEEIERGDKISPTLFAAIEGSKISIIIFSKNYASSTWCLKELAKIIECKSKMQHVVLPVFYNIDPSDVRKQSGTYADAFVKHEKYNQDKVQEWRRALQEAANSAGWDSSNTRLEAELVENIVNDILEKLNRIPNPQVPHGLVGVEEDIIHIESLLCIESKGVHIVGIWGMGGAGKTTIADFLFKKLSSKFQCCAFVENVREKWTRLGRDELRNQLFRQILEEPTLSIETSSIRLTNMVNRLQRRKVLIVLDDVSDFQQMNYLVEEKDWFGSGSRIIVTTRNKDVLPKENVGLHKVEPLNKDKALQLFCLKAFPNDFPKNEFKDLCKMVLDYVQGNPLAITILGSLLFSKNQEEWEGMLQKLKKVPNAKINDVLRLSYEELDYREKKIFLDIACILKGELKRHIIDLLIDYGSSINIDLRSLHDKSLITISQSEHVQMHDLVQEMGQHIVREESIEQPEKRSRLWDPEDIYHVLKCKTGNYHSIESISLNMSQIKEVQISLNVFTRMPRLRLLKFYMPNKPYISNSLEYPYKCNVIIPKDLECLPDHLRYLCWDHFPMNTLPSSFCVKMLVEIHLKDSPIKKLWEGDQDFVNLKILWLEDCHNLLELQYLNKAANLEEICISYCGSLRKLWDGDYDVMNLKILWLEGCHKLLELQCLNKATNLEGIHISYCRSLKKLWDGDQDAMNLKILWLERCYNLLELQCLNKATNLEEIHISSCGSLRKLWDGDQDVVNLKKLWLKTCDNLLELRCLKKVANLKEIHISYCGSLMKLWDAYWDIVNLKQLWLQNCDNLLELPYLKKVVNLEEICISYCGSLKKLWNGDRGVVNLKILWLECCHNLLELQCLNKATNLEEINIFNCGSLKKLWDGDQNAVNLKILWLEGCHNLLELQCLNKATNLEEIHISYCESLRKLWDGDQDVVNLKKVRLQNCDKLLELPCLRKVTNLEEISIFFCESLMKLWDGDQDVVNLKILWLEGCHNLLELQCLNKASNLEEIHISCCKSLKKLWDGDQDVVNLKKVWLQNCDNLLELQCLNKATNLEEINIFNCGNLKKLWDGDQNVVNMKILWLEGCHNLLELQCLNKATNLEEIHISYCERLRKLWDGDQDVVNLKKVRLQNCDNLLELPCLRKVTNLEEISIFFCESLMKLWDGDQDIVNLKILWLEGCHNLLELQCLNKATNLEEIHISYCESLKKLWDGDQAVVNLKKVRLQNCDNLLELPCLRKVANLEEISIFFCESLMKLWDGDQDVVNLKILWLGSCHNLLELQCLNKAANLEKIHISSCEGLKKLWDGDQDVVNLKLLWLEGCYNLLELQCLNMAANLEEIHIFYCEGLKKLWDGDQNVVNLKILWLEGCHNLLELQCLNKATNLEEIHISYCESLKKLWDGDHDVVNLKKLWLQNCHNTLELSCLKKVANLEEIHISDCGSLKKFWDGDQDVVNLKKLRLQNCDNLLELPCLRKVANLEEICISYCGSLMKLWDGDQDVGNLKNLWLQDCCNLLELPCLKKAANLEVIKILSCRSLLHVPSYILSLDSLLVLKLEKCTQLRCIQSDKPSKSLRKLSLFGCSNLTEFSVALENLHELCLNGTAIEELPISIGQVTNLLHLELNKCQRLKKFSPIPDTSRSISHLSTLKRLYLSETSIETLPSSIKLLCHLEELDVSGCERLRSLPELPPLLWELRASRCISLETVASIAPRALMKNCFHLQKSLLPMQNQEPKALTVNQFDFTNCTKLDENACKTILDEATIRIKYAAYVSSMEEASIDPYHQLYLCSEASDPKLFDYAYRLFLFKYIANGYSDLTRIENEKSDHFTANFNGISGGDLRRLVLALELNKEENIDVDFDTSVQRICMQQGFPIPIFRYVTGRWCMCVDVKLPGSRVPRWVRYRTTETPFIITIQLPPSSHLLDFACCFVFKKGVFFIGDHIKCECSVEDAKGNKISESFNFPLNPMTLISGIVYLCYKGRTFTRILKKLKEIRAIDKCSTFNPKLLFQFSFISSSGRSNDGLKECGVWPIYTSDLESANPIESVEL